MTDQAAEVPLFERLRDVPPEARFMWEVSEFHHASIPVGILCQKAADYMAETEAKIERRDQFIQAARDYVAELESRIKPVEQLPDKWREESGHEESERANWAINIRADELESALKANQ